MAEIIQSQQVQPPDAPCADTRRELSPRTLRDLRHSCHEKLRTVLKVRVVRGRNLYQTDRFSKIDPYLQVKYGQNVSTSIAHRGAGKNVEFDWPVSLPFDDKAVISIPLELIVMDNNTLRPDEEVGRCSLSHGQLKVHDESNKFEGELKLTRTGFTRTTKPAGLLDVQFHWECQSEAKFPNPTLRCISNHNVGGGVIRELFDGGKFKIFRTWQINLWFLDPVFKGETFGWNQSYDAAQKIYGDKKRSSVLRQMIRVQHSMLYSKDKGSGPYDEFEVHNLMDLYQLLPKSQSDSPSFHKGKRYTYVILPDSTMHFSRTGKSTGQDFLSKHALHAGAREDVVYAGEFFFDTKSERYAKSGEKPALIIDNNSGTFAPPKEALTKLQLLLELNFGTDLPIIALDREDPELKMYFEANEVE